MEVHLKERDRRYHLDCREEDGCLLLRGAGREPLRLEVESAGESTLLVRLQGRQVRARYARDGKDLWVQVGARTAHFHLLDEEEQEDLAHAAGSPVVRAPMPGKVLEILVEEGEEVPAGRPVVRVEAMKMEVDLPAAVGGTVQTIHVAAGDLVAPEAPLVTLKPDEG